MQFPTNLDITGQAPYMMLMPFRRVVDVSNNAFNVTTHKVGETIHLPLPQGGLSATDTHSWDQQQGLTHSLNSEGAWEKALGMLKNLGEKVAGESAKNYTSYQRGRWSNTYDSLMYGGVDLRDFSFDWTLIPQSPQDSTELQSIIRSIRSFSMPSRVGDQSVEYAYPDYWQVYVNFGNGVDKLFKIEDCVLTNITVDYSGDGVPRMFNDGAPMQVKLSMSFKELRRNSREAI